MNNEDTNDDNEQGKEADINSEDDKKPLSPVKEARAILDEIKKEKEELKLENDRREERLAKEMVGGHADAGQSPERKNLTEEEKKTKQAAEFFDGSALGDAIKKTNE